MKKSGAQKPLPKTMGIPNSHPEKAKMLDDVIARSDNERLRQDAMMKRDILNGTLETLEEQFRKARPVKSGGQGPKTRAFQRNMLRPESDDIQNALVK